MMQQFFLEHEGTSIYEIPPEVRDEIMLRADAFEVSRLRATVQELRGALTDEEFVQRFNVRGFDEQSSAEWSFIHYQTHSVSGALFGIRWSDFSSWHITLDDLLDRVVLDGDLFDLLCSNGSFFLFSRSRFHPDSFALIVVNITTGYVMVIDCPHPIEAPAFSVHRESIKLNLKVIANKLCYEIVHVLRDHQAIVPVLCVYSSINEEWKFIQQATLLAGNQQLDTQDPCSMILLTDPWFFVSVLNDLHPVYKQGQDAPVPFRDGRHIPEDLVSPGDDWVRISTPYYSKGSEGWVATMVKYVLPNTGIHPLFALTVISDIQLFRITPDWNRYEHKCRLPRHHLEPFDHVVLSNIISLESTKTMVQLTVAICADINLWVVKFFKFDIASQEWSIEATPPFHARRVSGVVLTPRLTL